MTNAKADLICTHKIGLEQLHAAIQASDPNRELYVRIGDLIRETEMMIAAPQALAATPAVGGEREALAAIMQRANESGTGEMALIDTIHAMHKLARDALADQPASPLRGRDATYESIRWQRVNDEPFEYAIQQGPHGDEFVKLIGGSCLRRSAASPPEQPAAVQDTYFVDSRLPIMAMSGDVESDRVLKLHFRRRVTDADRARLIEVLNAGENALCKPTTALPKEPEQPAAAHSEYLLDTLMKVYVDAVNNGDGYLGRAQLEYTLMKHDLCLVDARDREPAADPGAGRETLTRKKAVEFILSHDPFGDVFSQNDLALIESNERPPCPKCHAPYHLEGAERYWEARWRDEKAENDRLRTPAAVPETGREWQEIDTIPKDRPIDGWHKTWKCPVTIAYRSLGDRSAWVEKTLTTEWPIDAFTHWRETSEPPSTAAPSKEPDLSSRSEAKAELPAARPMGQS